LGLFERDLNWVVGIHQNQREVELEFCWLMLAGLLSAAFK
jgi:hypothetical protein